VAYVLLAIKAIGVFIAAIGVVCFLSQNAFQRIIQFWEKGHRAYLAGVLRLVFGTVFIIGANQTRSPALILSLGILFLIGGAVLFTIGVEKSRTIMQNWADKPAFVIQVLALIPILIGAIILCNV